MSLGVRRRASHASWPALFLGRGFASRNLASVRHIVHRERDDITSLVNVLFCMLVLLFHLSQEVTPKTGTTATFEDNLGHPLWGYNGRWFGSFNQSRGTHRGSYTFQVKKAVASFRFCGRRLLGWEWTINQHVACGGGGVIGDRHGSYCLCGAWLLLLIKIV